MVSWRDDFFSCRAIVCYPVVYTLFGGEYHLIKHPYDGYRHLRARSQDAK